MRTNEFPILMHWAWIALDSVFYFLCFVNSKCIERAASAALVQYARKSCHYMRSFADTSKRSSSEKKHKSILASTAEPYCTSFHPHRHRHVVAVRYITLSSCINRLTMCTTSTSRASNANIRIAISSQDKVKWVQTAESGWTWATEQTKIDSRMFLACFTQMEIQLSERRSANGERERGRDERATSLFQHFRFCTKMCSMRMNIVRGFVVAESEDYLRISSFFLLDETGRSKKVKIFCIFSSLSVVVSISKLKAQDIQREWSLSVSCVKRRSVKVFHNLSIEYRNERSARAQGIVYMAIGVNGVNGRKTINLLFTILLCSLLCRNIRRSIISLLIPIPSVECSTHSVRFDHSDCELHTIRSDNIGKSFVPVCVCVKRSELWTAENVCMEFWKTPSGRQPTMYSLDSDDFRASKTKQIICGNVSHDPSLNDSDTCWKYAVTNQFSCVMNGRACVRVYRLPSNHPINTTHFVCLSNSHSIYEVRRSWILNL